MMKPQKESFNQRVHFENAYGVELFIKREDVLHEEISGNKFRKLKYNLLAAKEEGKKRLLTFGGAYSNHIAAVAAAGKHFGFETVGIIRGDELLQKFLENPTLRKAHEDGMLFEFVSREQFRNKYDALFLNGLKATYGDYYLIPEGGTNHLAVKGCGEILNTEDEMFDIICCAVGTGGTVSGLINASRPHQTVLGFPALKGDFLTEEIKVYAENDRWKLITDYHFGGYAKINNELKQFMQYFFNENLISLDPVYTSKMVFGVFDLITKGYFAKGTKVLMIHTGGLQGLQSKIAEI